MVKVINDIDTWRPCASELRAEKQMLVEIREKTAAKETVRMIEILTSLLRTLYGSSVLAALFLLSQPNVVSSSSLAAVVSDWARLRSKHLSVGGRWSALCAAEVVPLHDCIATTVTMLFKLRSSHLERFQKLRISVLFTLCCVPAYYSQEHTFGHRRYRAWFLAPFAEKRDYSLISLSKDISNNMQRGRQWRCAMRMQVIRTKPPNTY
jgi:cytochrome c biogenesis factor